MKLSDTSLRRGTLPRRPNDGNNLYLRVTGRSRSWMMIFRSPATGKRGETGLGATGYIPRHGQKEGP